MGPECGVEFGKEWLRSGHNRRRKETPRRCRMEEAEVSEGITKPSQSLELVEKSG